MADDLNSIQIAHLSAALVEHVSTEDCDIGIKIAALRAAGDVLAQAVGIGMLQAAIRNALGPKG